jgi:hypothetical protein
MVNQGKSTLQFPIKTTLLDANDRVVFIYGADTANVAAPGNVAQTATITVPNLCTAIAPTLQVAILPSDPANSVSLVIKKGTVFATPSFLYVANEDNHTVRVALAPFP